MPGGRIYRGMSKKEHDYTDKYVTICLKYKQDNNSVNSYDTLKVINVLTSALWKYNQNRGSDDMAFDLFGIYLDYDDYSVPEQNKINADAKNDLHDKEKKD